VVVIAVTNQKGGVGKTTTAVTLAHGWACAGKRVLLMDLDSQGNVADSLGIEPGHELVRFLDPEAGEGWQPTYIEAGDPQSGRENLYLVRSDKHTAPLKRKLAAEPFGVQVLGERLKLLRRAPRGAAFDFVVMDCAPSVDILHTAAMVAADWLLIPTRLDQLAVKGVMDALGTLASLRGAGHSSCEVAGILPTFYDRVTTESHDQLVHLASQFGKLVMPPIPLDTQCRTATRLGRTLWELDPGGRAMAGMLMEREFVGGYRSVMVRLQEVCGVW